MKRFCHATRHFEIMYFPLLTVYLLFTLLIGFLGFRLLNSQYAREVNLAGSITGAVLAQHPDAKATLLDAIRATDNQNRDNRNFTDGMAILEQYGYRENLPLYGDEHRRHILAGFYALLLLLFFLFFIIISITFILLERNRRIHENQLLTLLSRCLDEDYSFLDHPEETGILFNETVTDTFLKLGRKLMLKTQALSEERDHTKTLVTDISHQLKTPVSALKNCLSICLEADSKAECDEFLQRCSLQLEKLESLMAALINISRLETSMITLHREPTVLSDIILDAVNSVYVKAMQKEISVEISDSEDNDDDPAASLSLPLDRKWTAEAVANILDNAVKYSPCKTAVTIRLYRLSSYVRMEIEDAGIGIPKAEYNKIFQRFYRGANPTVQHSDGAGVGLYLSRRIIEEQGGSVTVKAANRQGSIFVVQFPLVL